MLSLLMSSLEKGLLSAAAAHILCLIEASNGWCQGKNISRFRCWMLQILDWSNQTPLYGTGEWFRICLGMSTTLVHSRYLTESHKLLLRLPLVLLMLIIMCHPCRMGQLGGQTSSLISHRSQCHILVIPIFGSAISSIVCLYVTSSRHCFSFCNPKSSLFKWPAHGHGINLDLWLVYCRRLDKILGH